MPPHEASSTIPKMEVVTENLLDEESKINSTNESLDSALNVKSQLKGPRCSH